LFHQVRTKLAYWQFWWPKGGLNPPTSRLCPAEVRCSCQFRQPGADHQSTYTTTVYWIGGESLALQPEVPVGWLIAKHDRATDGVSHSLVDPEHPDALNKFLFGSPAWHKS